jgi:hypothetical protein
MGTLAARGGNRSSGKGMKSKLDRAAVPGREFKVTVKIKIRRKNELGNRGDETVGNTVIDETSWGYYYLDINSVTEISRTLLTF